MAQFQFELVSPEKLMISEKVAMVTVPGGEGEYGVLAGHAPMITTLKPGVISIYGDNESAITGRIFVAGGFAETTAERCTVLDEEAIPVSDLDREDIQIHIKMLHDSAGSIKTDAEREAAEAELAVAEAKLQALAA